KTTHHTLWEFLKAIDVRRKNVIARGGENKKKKKKQKMTVCMKVLLGALPEAVLKTVWSCFLFS
ncbi:MAG TPA: hypothetical protein VN457_04055, partial [Chlamydiales bacterium]|nr:hypothetical protein [Chlamydiales bacterium]